MADYLVPPCDAARRFTPEPMKLPTDQVDSEDWDVGRLSPRDRSIATLAALTVLHRPEQLPAHLKDGIANGLTIEEISALITHIAFYGGFPAAIAASKIAADTLL